MDLWTLIEADGLRIGTIRRCEWILVDAQGRNINTVHRCSRLAYCIEGTFKPIANGLEHKHFLRALREANLGQYLNASGEASDGPVSRVRVAPPGWIGAPLRITELKFLVTTAAYGWIPWNARSTRELSSLPLQKGMLSAP